MQEPVYLKRPAADGATSSEAGVTERVSEMLIAIERGGLDAVRKFSRELDDWDPVTFEVTAAEVVAARDALSDELRASIEKSVNSSACDSARAGQRRATSALPAISARRMNTTFIASERQVKCSPCQTHSIIPTQ